MFEKIVLRSLGAGSAVTAGKLAEALLFYGSVQLVLDEQSVAGLVRAIGVGAFIDLLRRPDVSATYVDGMASTISNPVGPMTVHAYGFISLSDSEAPTADPKKPQKRKASAYDVLPRQLIRAGIDEKGAKKLVLAMRSLVPVRPLGDKAFGNELISKLAFDDLADQDFLHRAVAAILRASLPERDVPSSFDLRVQDSDLGFYLFGNLDFAVLESARRIKSPDATPLDAAQVLLGILNARVDLTLASHYGGDFATSPLSSELIRLRFDVMLERKRLHDRQIDEFHSIVLEDVPTLAESIDSGSRSFTEFLRLLDKSAKFKTWAGGVHPDKGVVAAYLGEATRQDWIQGGPAKVIRYVIGAALGAPSVPAAAGAAWGLADSFGLDKMFGGWRPNHFVDKRLKPFVQPE